MAPYGVTANTIMPGANTRLAQIGWRTQRVDRRRRRHAAGAGDPRDPVHVAELGCFLASPEAGGISGQTFQVHGGTIEHVGRGRSRERGSATIAASPPTSSPAELPLDAGRPKPADRPPPEWTAAREARST